ncbi:MAG: type II toxin-antitoxin system HicA family toxin, partial [Clostridiales Family XIII bacterium]|nr:type II toxin-antitoxin system HicA family toxin [Clostridiales Family XIII bacterium]
TCYTERGNYGMTGKELIKLLQRNGWEIVRIRGSHHTLCNDDGKHITVPVHGNDDIKTGLLHRILSDAGLK